ncbi:hypothetical protein IAI10_02315 [Clostridium sp. 19966]|uniref:hypothetical protein n=1 Tax=Clostridium sp. 19966 TaxID=2768166 RepID=UPI0028DF7FE7|nr:hypothetical protein [Clostridium sp. 19966]MDT8715492.1 hypothetical protein [Clostridium sp. 19966]
MKINRSRKTTISVKMFISDNGDKLSEHIKERLMELEIRCVLVRKQSDNIFDLKHVEHLKYDSSSSESDKKEYMYGEFAIIEEEFYFSGSCMEDENCMTAPKVEDIYNSLGDDGKIVYEDKNFKKITDSNIDYIVDNILSVCPEVSETYITIVKGMLSRANNK